MDVISARFGLFLFGATVACNVAPPRFRTPLLLAASWLLFAGAALPHLFVLLLVTLVAYAGGIALATPRRPRVLRVFIALAAAPLLLSKYLELFLRAGDLAPATGAAFDSFVLPLGISFYTFRAISYLADVHRGRAHVERRFGPLALYLAFFPAALAGPIERASHLLPQLCGRSRSTARDLHVGLKYLAWGAFCKLAVADNVARIVDVIVASPDEQSGGSFAVAFSLYSFQIYFDFLGYTAIAIGAARLFGIELSRNFDRPYCAASLRDFWRRWHITLTSWLRDYVYVPLGGGSTSGSTRIVQVMSVFLLSGLWHGAAWNYLAWGGIHGAGYLVEERLRAAAHPPAARLSGRWRAAAVFVRVGLTFTFVTAAWIFFRLSEPADVRLVFERLVLADNAVPYTALNAVLFERRSVVTVLVLLVAFVLDASKRVEAALAPAPRTRPQLLGELMFVNGVAVALLLLGGGASRDFIYFDF